MITDILPHDLSAERIVLASMLISDEALNIGVIELNDRMFYNSAHRKIYQSIQGLFESNTAIDSITVSDRLRSSNDLDAVGGESYISELLENVVTTRHIESHIKIIKNKSALRELIRIGNELSNCPAHPDADPDEIMESIGSKLINISSKKEEYDHAKAVHELLKDNDEIVKSGRKMIGYPIGLPRIDNLMSGIQPLTYIIPGKEKLGKSRLALFVTEALLRHGMWGCWFSMEMRHKKLNRYILSNRTGINTSAWYTSAMTQDNRQKVWLEASERYMQEPIYIDTTSRATIPHIRSRIQQLKIKHKENTKGGFVVVDYIQRGVSGNLVEGIEEYAKTLADVQRDENVTMILLSQVNNDGSTKWGKAIREAADVILTIKKNGDRIDNINSPVIQPMQLYIEQRDGEGDMPIDLHAQLGLCRFYEVDDIHEDF